LTCQSLVTIFAAGFATFTAQDRALVESMSAQSRHTGTVHVPMFTPRSGGLVRALFGFVAVALLFIQTIHPGMHPHEVIGPDTYARFGCPINHAIADLPPELPPLLLMSLVPVSRPDPWLWLGHLYFYHALAPRPPPVIHR
jgi:hypothetical protein